MTEPLDKRIKKILKDLYPGLTEIQIVIATYGIDFDVPHYHGRIPDSCELIDLQALRIVLEALGVVFPSPGPNEAILLDGTVLDSSIVDPPIRVEGAPATYPIESSSLYTRVRNVWFPLDLTSMKTFALVTGIRQGIINPVVGEAADITGNKILDIISLEGVSVPAGTEVHFVPANPNWLTEEGLRGRTWRWTFGSGPNQVTEYPIAQNLYSVPGTYTVTLTGSTDEQGDISIVKTNYLTVT